MTLVWAMLLGLFATVSGVALGAVVPGYESPGWMPGGFAGPSSQTVVSPLVEIKPQLLNPGGAKLFEVKASPAGAAAYWRLMALDDFNGNAWGFSADYVSVRQKISYLPPEAFAGRDRSLRQSYRIGQLGGRWLPAAYQAIRISGVDASADFHSSALIARRGLNKGAQYEVTSAVPNPNIEDLRKAPPRSAGPQNGSDPTKLSGVSDEVRKIAADWTSGKPTPYDKVAAISERLRKFRYDESVPAGHAADRLLFFLTTSKAGYCEQFAAAMAVLARTLGIPARVAVGFLPGNLDPVKNSYLVTSREAHAWPEVYFEGVGWVPFEPTPRAGISSPSYDAGAVTNEKPATQSQQEEPAPSPPPESAPPPEQGTPEPSSAQSGPKAASKFWPSVFVVVALVVVLLFAIVIAKRWRIRRRYRRAATPTEKVRAAFFNFEDRLIDLSRPRAIAQTPAEFMEQARTGFRLDRDATGVLIGNFEIAAFSGGDLSDSEAQAAMNAAALLSSQLWAGSSWGGRLGLLVSPRSLLIR